MHFGRKVRIERIVISGLSCDRQGGERGRQMVTFDQMGRRGKVLFVTTVKDILIAFGCFVSKSRLSFICLWCLECVAPTCSLGVEGARLKLSSLPPNVTVQTLNFNMQFNHGGGVQGGRGASSGGGPGCRLQKMERSRLSANCSQTNFIFFQGTTHTRESG